MEIEKEIEQSIRYLDFGAVSIERGHRHTAEGCLKAARMVIKSNPDGADPLQINNLKEAYNRVKELYESKFGKGGLSDLEFGLELQ